MTRKESLSVTTGRILVEIRPTDPSRIQTKLHHLFSMIQEELGMEESIWKSKLQLVPSRHHPVVGGGGPRRIPSRRRRHENQNQQEQEQEQESSSTVHPSWKVFLALDATTQRVVGLCTVETITHATPFDVDTQTPLLSGIITHGTTTTITANMSKHPTQVKARMGIAHLWVHSTVRRQSVATWLLDMARSKFLFGTIVAKSDMAISSPTRAGWDFWISYCYNQNKSDDAICPNFNSSQFKKNNGNKSVLVYDYGRPNGRA